MLKYQKKFIGKTAVLLSMILFITIFSSLGDGSLWEKAYAASSVWDNAERTDYTIRFTEKNPEQRFELHLAHMSRVRFVGETYGTDCFTVRIYNLNNSVDVTLISQDMGMNEGNSEKNDWDTYLDAGDYEIVLNCKGQKKVGTNEFAILTLPVDNGYEPNPGRDQNEHMSAYAFPGEHYKGTVCIDHRLNDTYLLRPVVPYGSFHLTVDSYVDRLNVILLKVANGHSLIISHARISAEHDKKTTLNEDWSFPGEGDYYLLFNPVGTADCGKYSFSFNTIVDKKTDHPVQYLLPGEKTMLLSDSEKDEFNKMTQAKGINHGISKIDENAYVTGLTQGYDLYQYYMVRPSSDSSGMIELFEYPVVVEFSDVRHVDRGNAYYYDPVYWAATEHITGGVKDPDGVVRRFDPEGLCTRAQMVSFLWRMEGCPEPKKAANYKDVPKNAYYYKAVAWSEEKGITGGYPDGTFRPNNLCSRAQAVSFLYRLAGCPKVNSKQTFTDVKKGMYYTDAVAWAAEKKITGGYSNGTFRPDGSCSRAQMVTFLYRYKN